MEASYSKNNLDLSTSRYLLQHKDDPVAWQPWRQDVLDYAQEQGKPILLSIGYAACQWCHIMARESFADPATAELMNSRFVNIKVDREERPDLDGIYQTAHQLLTGRPGGWPLTLFLCPRSRLPFLAGTYFPAHAAEGQIAFGDLLLRISDYYQNRGSDFVDTLDRVRDSYEAMAEGQQTLDSDVGLSRIPIERATEELLKNADIEHGGFGAAPKFPMPVYLERLLLAASEAGQCQQAARQHLHRSLRILARTGINDQVNGGFFRYTTDQRWETPCFEKMLYDNALLLAVYVQGWTLLHDSSLEDAARGIARWALRDMLLPEGTFAASLGADAAGEEGAFYLWSPEEVEQVLSGGENRLIQALFALGPGTGATNSCHLHQPRDWEEVLSQLQMQASEAQALLASGREKLRAAREAHPRPVADQKVLTAWNALTVRALAMAGRAFGDREYVQAAQGAMDFIQDRLWVNQRLYTAWQNGKAQVRAYLDDYAYTMDALMELLQTEWRDRDYRFLGLLAESLINNFEDQEQGGFFFTAHDAEELIFRNKPFQDGVLPSSNGVAARVLMRFGHLAGEPRYLTSARRVLHNGWPSMLRQPAEHHSLLQALDEHLAFPPQVLLKGDARMESWRRAIEEQFGRRVHCYRVPKDSEVHPPELFLLDDDQGAICSADGCSPPHDTLADLMAQLTAVLEGEPLAAVE